MTKLLNALSDRIVIADVYRTFVEQKTHHSCTKVIKQHHFNNKINITDMSHLVTSDCLVVHSANICILQFINSLLLLLLLLLLLFLNCALKQKKNRKYMNQYKQLLVAFKAY